MVGNLRRSQGHTGQGSESESHRSSSFPTGSAAWACGQNLLSQARTGRLARGVGVTPTSPQGRLAPRMTMQHCGFCLEQGP